MAKATKQKVKEEISETQTGITAPVENVEVEKKKEEASTPESILPEEPLAPPVMVVEEFIPSEILHELAKPAPSHIEKTFEESVMEFIDSRESGNIKMNDFLKSLYKVPRANEMPEWKQMGAAKYLRMVLDMMVKKGEIMIVNDTHLQLGKPFHSGEQQIAQNHNLGTVEIVCKK